MKTKAKGSRRERQAQAILESQGYLVMHSAASLGMFDLIAINSTSMRLIQVKANRTPSPAEMESIRQLAVPGCATKEVWTFVDYKQEPLITVVGCPDRGAESGGEEPEMDITKRTPSARDQKQRLRRSPRRLLHTSLVEGRKKEGGLT